MANTCQAVVPAKYSLTVSAMAEATRQKNAPAMAILAAPASNGSSYALALAGLQRQIFPQEHQHFFRDDHIRNDVNVDTPRNVEHGAGFESGGWHPREDMRQVLWSLLLRLPGLPYLMDFLCRHDHTGHIASKTQ